MRNESWVWPEVGTPGRAARGAVPLRSAQMMGLQQQQHQQQQQPQQHQQQQQQHQQQKQEQKITNRQRRSQTTDLSGDEPVRVVPRKAVMWHYHTAFLVESGW